MVIDAIDLPETLVLPLRRGAPYWYWLGGRPAIDLVNTLRERWRRQVETLVTPADLGEWLVAAELLPTPMRPRRSVLDDARELREAIDRCVAAAVGQGPSDPASVKLIDDWLVHAGGRPELRLADGEVELGERPPADSPRRALGMVALDAATMLGTTDQRERIRICAGEACSARFYDRSPAGGRRWCSMRSCGNVAKARRHRARTRADA